MFFCLYMTSVFLLLLLRKKYGKKSTWKKVRPDSASSGHVTLSFSVKKAPLVQILCNFRLCMRRTYFRTWPLPDRDSSGHVTDVTSGHACAMVRSSSILRKYYLNCSHILLESININLKGESRLLLSCRTLNINKDEYLLYG
jgi:hypothetical protein